MPLATFRGPPSLESRVPARTVDELYAGPAHRSVPQHVDVRYAERVDAGLIGEQRDALAANQRQTVADKDVNPGKYFGGWRKTMVPSPLPARVHPAIIAVIAANMPLTTRVRCISFEPR